VIGVVAVAGEVAAGMGERLRCCVTLLQPGCGISEQVDVAGQPVGTAAVTMIARPVRGQVVREVGRVVGEGVGRRDVGGPQMGAGR
jgi:hypothetical protein